MEVVAPGPEKFPGGGWLGGRELAVVEPVQLFEGSSDVGGGEAGVELLGPADDRCSGAVVLEGFEVGEVAAFGSVEDGEDLAGGEVSGVQEWDAVDGRGWVG